MPSTNPQRIRDERITDHDNGDTEFSIRVRLCDHYVTIDGGPAGKGLEGGIAAAAEHFGKRLAVAAEHHAAKRRRADRFVMYPGDVEVTPAQDGQEGDR